MCQEGNPYITREGSSLQSMGRTQCDLACAKTILQGGKNYAEIKHTLQSRERIS